MTTFRIKAVDKDSARHSEKKKPYGWLIALLGTAAVGICALLAWMAHEHGVDLWRYVIVLMKMY